MDGVVALRRARCVCVFFCLFAFLGCVLGLFFHSVILCSFSTCLGLLVSLVYLVRSVSFGRVFFSITLFLRVAWIHLVIAIGNGRWELRDASTLAGLGMVVCTGLGYVWVMGMCKSRAI